MPNQLPVLTADAASHAFPVTGTEQKQFPSLGIIPGHVALVLQRKLVQVVPLLARATFLLVGQQQL